MAGESSLRLLTLPLTVIVTGTLPERLMPAFTGRKPWVVAPDASMRPPAFSVRPEPLDMTTPRLPATGAMMEPETAAVAPLDRKTTSPPSGIRLRIALPAAVFSVPFAPTVTAVKLRSGADAVGATCALGSSTTLVFATGLGSGLGGVVSQVVVVPFVTHRASAGEAAAK